MYVFDVPIFCTLRAEALITHRGGCTDETTHGWSVVNLRYFIEIGERVELSGAVKSSQKGERDGSNK